MKYKTVSLITLAAALVLALGVELVGCGGSGGSAPADNETEGVPGTPTTIQYASFNMPDGWVDSAESDSYVTIEDGANDNRTMKIFVERYFGDDTLEAVTQKEAGYYGEDALGAEFDMGIYHWVSVNFTFKDNPSRKFYAQLDDEHYVYVTAFEMTEDDEEVKIVLSTLSAEVPE